MKTLTCLLACLFVVFGVAFGQSTCLQDDFGNQYNFTVDTTTAYLYGTVKNAQGCPGGTWPLMGTLVATSQGNALELTAANPEGSTSGTCFPTYMLKGVLPNFAWYYALGGTGTAGGTWAACGTSISKKPAGKGAVK